MFRRISYWNRIIKAYIMPSTSQLTFWHGTPQVNPNFQPGQPGPYYMKFHYKADYKGHFDKNGIPMLDYHGNIGLQYNPIAISQYGLGNYNLYYDSMDTIRFQKFIATANWLVDNLEPNNKGIPVWHHYFDFEYRDTLKSPWYSGLAQGLGISVLLRAYEGTKNSRYLDCSLKAFESMTKPIESGGVLYIDNKENVWLEEYIVDPPTHILNGFIWGLWGIYDISIFLKDQKPKELFDNCVNTLIEYLEKYDTGYWSLYEQSGTTLPMLASPFYHSLHIIQLKVMKVLTGKNIFYDYATKWEEYQSKWWNRKISYIGKGLFKILYY